MKYIILLLVGFSSIFALEVHKNVVLKKELHTDHYMINISLSQEDRSKGDIEINFEKAIDIAKDNGICQGGGYSIYPRYKYVDNTKEFIHYSGSITFNCIFKDDKKIENIVDGFDRLRDVKIAQGKIYPTLTDEQTKQMEQSLELEAYKYAKEYVSFLSQTLHKQCLTKEIVFDPKDSFSISPRGAVMTMDTRVKNKSNISKPLDTTREKTLRVDYIFSCED